MKHVHGGNVEEIAKRYGLRKEKIIDFSANINPWGPSPRVIKTLKKNLGRISHYPDPETIKLREELSKYLKINPENIIAGNGAVELIHLISRTLRPKKALIVVPTFSEYESALKNVGCKIEFFPLKSRDDFRLDIEGLLRHMKKIDLPRPSTQLLRAEAGSKYFAIYGEDDYPYEGRGLLFLCNPNNPTGQLINKADMLKIVGVARKRGVFVVVDEVFMDFVESAEAETLIHEAIKRDGLFIIRSLTKFFALPGIRIGYGIGNKGLFQRLKDYKEYWSVNTLAQIAGIAALKDKEYIERTKRLIPKERKFLYRKLSKINSLKPYPSVTNFIFCRLSDRTDSKKLREEVIQKNILIRDCSSFRTLNNKYIRIAVKTHQENLRLINSLSNIL